MSPPIGWHFGYPGAPPKLAGEKGSRARERLDVGLFLRRLFGFGGFRLTRLLPRGKLFLLKEHCAHAIVLLLVAAVVSANLFASSADRGSLLFALFREAEVEEGPFTGARGQNGSVRPVLLGLIPAAAAGGITEEDIEFELANTLGGNALVATASPETAEASEARRRGVLAYAVREGDTPASIAARFGISTNTVLWANGIAEGDVIRAGDVLVILPVSGVLHAVAAGDDVTSLAQKYDAKVEDIVVRNGLSDAGDIRVGQKLIIPDGQLRAPAPRLAYHREEEAEAAPAPKPPPARVAPGLGFLWPLASRTISQYFGWRHTGLDISDRSRPPAYAAKEGKVQFAGWLGGYGRLVVLDHGGGLRTYYAHLGQTYVREGEVVARGEAVGKVGCTGRCTGPHLHFEVRQNGRPANPLRYF